MKTIKQGKKDIFPWYVCKHEGREKVMLGLKSFPVRTPRIFRHPPEYIFTTRFPSFANVVDTVAIYLLNDSQNT